MQVSNLILIAAAELAALLLVACIFLLVQNRSLRYAVRKLQSRVKKLVSDLKLARSEAKAAKNAPPKATTDYKHFLNIHINKVRDHHETLGANRDIVLDIDPETPLPRRAAALRYAVLMAEKEATGHQKHDNSDWKLLQHKYEQLFRYYDAYAEAEPEPDESTLEALNDELQSAKKRINNLERFKALYFDLEEKWESCRDNASTHIEEITRLTADTENAKEVENVLQAYNESYKELGQLIENGVDGQSIAESSAADRSGEIQHLRAVAADQHRIITELQRKLEQASSEEEKEEVVHELQGELQKQIRFVQESETCIQLMEDELNNANKEMEQLRSRLRALPQIKKDLMELRDQNDDYELQVHALKSENRRLMGKLKELNGAPKKADNGEVKKVKKALAASEARYAELEEKFLNLKMQK